MKQTKTFFRIDVSGDSEELWKNLKHKSVQTVFEFLDSTVQSESDSLIKEEAAKLISELVAQAEQVPIKGDIDNERRTAEIDRLYSSKIKQLAETRKINAESDAIGLSVSLNKLKVSLGLAKTLLLDQADQREIMFIKKIDNFLDTLNLY